MTTPPLHNTDASIDELFNMVINPKQVAVTTVTREMDIWQENSKIAEQANRHRAEFKQTVLSLLAEARQQTILLMPRHRRRAMTPQERSFEAEVASFVRAYPDMTLKDYWLGRWHQKSNLGAASVGQKESKDERS